VRSGAQSKNILLFCLKGNWFNLILASQADKYISKLGIFLILAYKMCPFLLGFYQFIVQMKPMDQLCNSCTNEIFILSTGLIGFVVTIMDVGLVKARIGKSLLKLQYAGFGRTIAVIMMWTAWATFMGWMCLAFGLYGHDVKSCVIIAFSWIYIVSDITNRLYKPQDIQD